MTRATEVPRSTSDGMISIRSLARNVLCCQPTLPPCIFFGGGGDAVGPMTATMLGRRNRVSWWRMEDRRWSGRWRRQRR